MILRKRLALRPRQLACHRRPTWSLSTEIPMFSPQLSTFSIRRQRSKGFSSIPNHHSFVSASHGEEELTKTLEACEVAFRAVKKALDRGY